MTNGRCGPGTLSSSPPRPPRSQVAALLGATLTTSMSNLAQTTVLGLLVYELTGSELALGFLGLAEFAPAALLVVVAGSVVDRFDRVHVAALGALSNAVVALAMAWYVRDPHGMSTTPIFLLVIAFGTGQAFLSPAIRSIPPAMVPNAGVPWLVARRSIAAEAATILGPILGGLLYVAGVWVALVAVAGLSLMGAAAILAIRTANEERLRTSELSPVGDDEVGHVLEEGIPASRGGLHEALEGLRFVRATPVLLGAISLDLFAVLFGGAVTLLPAIAVRLQVGAGRPWLAEGLGGLGRGRDHAGHLVPSDRAPGRSRFANSSGGLRCVDYRPWARPFVLAGLRCHVLPLGGGRGQRLHPFHPCPLGDATRDARQGPRGRERVYRRFQRARWV